MTITLTPNLTLITECDSITDWDADATVKAPTLDTEFYKEATGSISALLNEDKTPADYNFMRYTLPSNLDLRGTHIYFQFNTAQAALLEDLEGGGIRFEVEDTVVNRGGWYLDGKDTYDGGWRSYVVDTTRDFHNGSCNLSDVDAILFHIFLTAASAKAAINTWVDIVRYGDGLTIGSGSSIDPGTFAEIDTLDNSEDNMYGVFKNYEGIYFNQGKLTFGSGNAYPTYFKDTNKTVVFRDTMVSSNLYEIIISGSKTVFQLGTKAGTAGVQGCTVSVTQNDYAASALTWGFDALTYPVSGVRLYGCTFGNANSFKLPTYNSDLRNEVLSCTFTNCEILGPSSCTFKYNNIISALDTGLEMEPGHHMSDCSFISCPSGILISSAGGAYTLTNMTFTDVNKHIVNMTGTWVSASAGGTSDASTYVNYGNSTTKITSTKTITISTIDSDSNNVSGAVVTIYSGQTSSALANKTLLPTSPALPQVTWDGNKEYEDVSVEYNYSDWGNNVPITIRVRKSTPGTGNRYIPYKSVGTMKSADFSLTATLIDDEII